jgi:hypothetical protein
MTKNIGSKDKSVRIGIAIILAVLYAFGILPGTVGVIALILAVALVVTSLTGVCGLYKIFGINTCPVKPEQIAQNQTQTPPMQ